MNNLMQWFMSQQSAGGGGEKTYSIHVTSSTNSTITVTKDLGTIIGNYSYNSYLNNKYNWNLDFTYDELFESTSSSTKTIQLTFTQSNSSKTKTLMVSKTAYSYTLDMEPETYTCTISGTVKSNTGGSIRNATIREFKIPTAGDTISAVSDLSGNYTWTGKLLSGSHTINCTSTGYIGDSSTFNVSTLPPIGGQKITRNFVLIPQATVQRCTFKCLMPSKNATLLLRTVPSSPTVPIKQIGSCTKGQEYSYTLIFDENFKEGTVVEIYDMNQISAVYGTFTLVSGKIFNFNV